MRRIAWDVVTPIERLALKLPRPTSAPLGVDRRRRLQEITAIIAVHTHLPVREAVFDQVAFRAPCAETRVEGALPVSSAVQAPLGEPLLVVLPWLPAIAHLRVVTESPTGKHHPGARIRGGPRRLGAENDIPIDQLRS